MESTLLWKNKINKLNSIAGKTDWIGPVKRGVQGLLQFFFLRKKGVKWARAQDYIRNAWEMKKRRVKLAFAWLFVWKKSWIENEDTCKLEKQSSLLLAFIFPGWNGNYTVDSPHNVCGGRVVYFSEIIVQNRGRERLVLLYVLALMPKYSLSTLLTDDTRTAGRLFTSVWLTMKLFIAYLPPNFSPSLSPHLLSSFFFPCYCTNIYRLRLCQCRYMSIHIFYFYSSLLYSTLCLLSYNIIADEEDTGNSYAVEKENEVSNENEWVPGGESLCSMDGWRERQDS